MLHFFSETDDFTLDTPQIYADWLNACVEKENYKIDEINFIFCDDEYLLEINKKHLNHDYYTDIITFDYSNDDNLSGDIFISIERVADNAFEFNSSFEIELCRVMIHGLLHMMSYNDKTPEEKTSMREKENEHLNLIYSINE